MSVLTDPITRSGGMRNLFRLGIEPIDPPRAHASGPTPYRVLAVGGELLAGRGVLRHDLALSGGLARGIARATGFGVDVDAVIALPMSVRQAERVLADRPLLHYDAVVLLLEPGRGRIDGAEVRAGVRSLLTDLRQRLSPRAAVTVVLPPTWLASETAVTFASAVRAGAGELATVTGFVERLALDAPAERYAVLGEVVASSVTASLSAPMAFDAPEDVLDEARRQRAVQALGPLGNEWESRFHRVVTLARHAYGASCASISVIDGARTQYRARQGFETGSLPRDETICDLVLRTHAGVIVGDAQADPRFASFPITKDGALRFYAGHRILDRNGQPIGALCVFDAAPRPVLTQDLALLRDFALSVERRLAQFY